MWIWLERHPEVVPLVVNLAMLGRYLRSWRTDTGKLLYWLGATILTGGLLKMKG